METGFILYVTDMVHVLLLTCRFFDDAVFSCNVGLLIPNKQIFILNMLTNCLIYGGKCE